MNQSGCKFTSPLTTQLPRFDTDRKFRKKLKAGRPHKGQKRQYWIK